MQTISAGLRELVDNYARVNLHLTLGGLDLTGQIGRAVYKAQVGGDQLSLGSACAASMEIELSGTVGLSTDQGGGDPVWATDDGAGNITLHNVTATEDGSGNIILSGTFGAVDDGSGNVEITDGSDGVTVTWESDGTEIPLFAGRVDVATVRAGRTTIAAYDAMYFGGSETFSPSPALLTDVAAGTALQAIATAMGVSLSQEAQTLAEGVTIPGGFSGLTEAVSNAQAAGYVAAILGGNAMIDREGALTVRQYAEADWETEVYSGGAAAKNKDFSLGGLAFTRTDQSTVRNGDGTSSEIEETRMFAAGTGELLLENPLSDQAAADRAWAALGGITVRQGRYSFPAGIQIEPGDIITAKSMDGDYPVAVTALVMTLDGGVKTEILSGGPPASGGSTGPVSQALKTLEADFARVRSLVAENATINSANIETLRAGMIETKFIRSPDYAVETVPQIYPETGIYPENGLYPSNGELVIAGFAIDMEHGMIYGGFYSEQIAALEIRVEALEDQAEDFERRIYALEHA